MLSPAAVRQLRALRAHERTLLKKALTMHLRDTDATQETGNRFWLRRCSPYADFELRVRELRVFYRVVDDEVRVVMIGRKKGNALVVDRKRFVL